MILGKAEPSLLSDGSAFCSCSHPRSDWSLMTQTFVCMLYVLEHLSLMLQVAFFETPAL